MMNLQKMGVLYEQEVFEFIGIVFYIAVDIYAI